ncbi:hypothetical protein CEXT_9541 [Caerostris extrusa]|uniref:Uncharacterized protein n=1 Tax=Caerostris extrusa TaxID=172846 RepID=A0AAV4YDU6_CAEEX|nr:hypothetical protein CEXT_9541 [Caerostris extrusa]
MVSAIPRVCSTKGFIGYSEFGSSSLLGAMEESHKTFCQEGKGSRRISPLPFSATCVPGGKSSVGIMPFRNGYEKGDFSAFWHLMGVRDRSKRRLGEEWRRFIGGWIRTMVSFILSRKACRLVLK